MRQLTSEGQQKVTELAQRDGVSTDAVRTLLPALVSGQGAMSQCEHRELGGGGQWIRGGMSMRGAMGNQALKTTVEGLCLKRSRLLTPDLLQAQPAGRHMQSQGTQSQQRNSLSQEDRGNSFTYACVCVANTARILLRLKVRGCNHPRVRYKWCEGLTSCPSLPKEE
jgi:hypothetical protein